ncbi:hypothetical protein [Halocatena pleomorpha]|nr:hypothetical protein [Halocatena pleomorpha]
MEEHEPNELSDTECQALHEMELGAEWVHRAHGTLIEFHHDIGHGMDHFARAETLLRDAGRTELADALRDEQLPRGIDEHDRWSYEIIEEFRNSFLSEITAFENAAHQRVANGKRHVTERAQKEEWSDRARTAPDDSTGE